jgi:hypothetical protein
MHGFCGDVDQYFIAMGMHDSKSGWPSDANLSIQLQLEIALPSWWALRRARLAVPPEMLRHRVPSLAGGTLFEPSTPPASPRWAVL